MDKSDKKYGKDSIVGVVSKVTKLVGGYGSLWLLTDILSDVAYGGYVTALAIISLLVLIAQAGLRQATIQRVGELSVTNEGSVRTYVGAAITWVSVGAVLITTITWLLSPLAGYFIDQTVVRWIRLLVLALPGMALLPICGGALRGLERVSVGIILDEIAVQAIRLPVLGFAWFYWRDPLPVAIAIGLGYYVPIAVFGIKTRGWLHLNFTGISTEHMYFSGYLLINSVASKFMKETDVLLLASLATLSLTGGYNIAWKLAFVAQYGDKILTNTIQPRISKYLADENIGTLRKEFNKVRDISIVGTIPAVILFLLFGPNFLALFGDYVDQFNVLLVLTIGASINASFGSIGQILLMGKHGRLILVNTILSLGGNILLNILLIPEFGTMGAAIATVLTVFFLTNLIGMVQVYYYMGINTFDPIPIISVGILTVGVILTVFELCPTIITVTLATALALMLLYRRASFLREFLTGMTNVVN